MRKTERANSRSARVGSGFDGGIVAADCQARIALSDSRRRHPLLYAARDGRTESAKISARPQAGRIRRSQHLFPIINVDHNRVEIAKFLIEKVRYQCRRLVWAHRCGRRSKREIWMSTTHFQEQRRSRSMPKVNMAGFKVQTQRESEETPLIRRFLLPTGSLEWVDLQETRFCGRTGRRCDGDEAVACMARSEDPNIRWHDSPDFAAGINWVVDQTCDEGRPAAEAVKLCFDLGD